MFVSQDPPQLCTRAQIVEITYISNLESTRGIHVRRHDRDPSPRAVRVLESVSAIKLDLPARSEGRTLGPDKNVFKIKFDIVDYAHFSLFCFFFRKPPFLSVVSVFYSNVQVWHWREINPNSKTYLLQLFVSRPTQKNTTNTAVSADRYCVLQQGTLERAEYGRTRRVDPLVVSSSSFSHVTP